MICNFTSIDLDILQKLFDGKYDIIIVKNADEDILKKIANVKDIWISDNHKDDIPELGIHANDELPWHVDRILQEPIFCINNLFCKKFNNGASPTMFNIMRRPICQDHKKVKITYTMPEKLDGLKIKKDFIGRSKTYNLVQEDKYGEYYLYTGRISDKDYSYLWDLDEYQYTHHWEIGDLVLWNNYTVAHKRLDSKKHSREFIKQYFLDENEIFGYRRLE